MTTLPAHACAAGLQAFVLTGAPDSLADFEAHARDIAVVYPTDYTCARASGRVLGEGSPGEADAIAAYAHTHGIAVMPRFDCRDGPTVHAILTDPSIRTRTLGALVGIAKNPAYAGINLDLENDAASDRDAMSAFVHALAAVLHRQSRGLSVDVDGVTHEDPRAWTGFYDDRAISRAADYVFVMAWGTHWEGSGPGPIAPLAYVAAVARHLASLPHARQRIVLGVPMYGLDWTISGGRPATALQYANVMTLARSIGAGPVRNATVDEPTLGYTRAHARHRVWYMDAQSIADRLRLAREYGLQAGVWRLGEEDQSLWSDPAAVEGGPG